jgi:hypothetical protein
LGIIGITSLGLLLVFAVSDLIQALLTRRDQKAAVFNFLLASSGGMIALLLFLFW